MKASLATRITRAAWRSTYRFRRTSATLRAALAGRVTILLYHRIAEHDDAGWMETAGLPVTPPHVFRQHLQILANIGSQFLTLDELADGNLPAADKPAVVVTFDDGFADNFATACPLLEEFSARGVFFVTTSLPEQKPLWDHRLAWLSAQPEASTAILKALQELSGVAATPETLLWNIRQLLSPEEVLQLLERVEEKFGSLPRDEYLPTYGTWEQIIGADRAGHQIGAHTVHHWMRHTMPADEFLAEAATSKRQLEQHLGHDVRAFSYPFNSHLFSDEQRCREIGFDQIATVDPGRVLPRAVEAQLGHLPRRTVFSIHDDSTRFIELLMDEGFTN